MSAKQIFVDTVSFPKYNNKENVFVVVLVNTIRMFGKFCNCAKDADLVIVCTSQAAITALSANDTNQVVLTAVEEGWEDELRVGLNLSRNYPDRFTMYGLTPMPEIGVDGAENVFYKLK